MSLKVKYLDVPEGVQEATQVDGQGQPISNLTLVASGAEDIAYATLEPGGWPLDGTRKVMPNDVQTGFWSTAVSADASAEFADPPVITITFPDKYTATGISIIFSPSSGEWCTEICVSWYDGTQVIAQETAFPTEAYWTIQKAVEGFDKVTVELRKTNYAGHFAKVQRIEIGQTQWFDQEEITSVHMVNEIDPSLSELTVDTMQIDIHDRKNRALFPQKNQRMELYYNDSLYAAHYITGSSRQAKQYYTFSCQSAIGRLDNEYLGGIYNATPISEVLEDLLEGFEFVLNSKFSEKTITGYLPICTRREALQQIVFAIGAIVTTQGGRSIRIEPLPSAISATFTKSNIFQGSKVETAPHVAKVEVVAHKYSQSSEVETLMDAETVNGSDMLVTFADPHHSYAITGGTITGSGANWVTITASGAVTLTGKKYVHSTVRHVKRNAAATAADRNNIFAADEATLVHSENVAEVVQRLYVISQLRQTLTQEAVVTTQRAGQKVTSENPWGALLQGYITAMESDLTPTGHTAAVTVLGVELKNDIFHYSGQLQSGDMEVLYGVPY